jgi:large subunit ribosomal protein L25
VISHVLNEIEIECLPADLPEFVELDLAKIEAGHTLHVKDIVLPKGVALVAHLDAENPVIASATVPAAVVSDEAASGGAAAPSEGDKPAA